MTDIERELEQAQAEVARFQEREAYFARALRVADAGQYRADWPGAIERAIKDRDEARAACIAKDEALIKAADTFRDFHTALTMLNHHTSASAALIAEQATRAAIGTKP